MTGPLEWLSQEPLENRKADKLITREAPIAIRSIQTAERDIERAAHSAEIADRRRAISARFAALRSAAEQQIIAHVQGKITLIDPSLSPAARRAATEQLIAEQAAALLQLELDIKQQCRQARRASGRALNSRFKKRRSTIVARHTLERAASRSLFGERSRISQRPPSAFPAIRRIIPLLKWRPPRRPRTANPRI